MTEYTSRCPTLLWDVFSSTSNSFLTWFCNSLVTVRFHSSLVHRGHTQYENIVYKSKGPQSVFPVTFITVLHICTYLVGALRWYAVHSEKPCALYLKSLVCSSFCPSITQIRGKDQEKKDIYFFFLHWFPMQLVTWMPVLKTLSCTKCVYMTHIQHEAALSQLVHLNTFRAPCRGAWCSGSNIGHYCCAVS